MKMEMNMKAAALLTALVLASSSLVTLPAAAAGQSNNRGTTIQLANGKTLTFHFARFRGVMMAMVPAIDLSDVFHRPH